jgi:uncharacterized protein (TIGR02001 family)
MSTAFARCSLPRLTACLLGPLAAAALAADGDVPAGGSTVPAPERETQVAAQEPGGRLLESGAADANRPEFEAEAEFASKYYWRGLTINNDPVMFSSLSASWQGFTASVWDAYDFTNYNNRRDNIEEVDYSLSYSHELDLGFQPLTLDGGMVWYTYPNTGPQTGEFFASATFGELALSPGMTVFYDFVKADGFYLNPTLEHSFDLSENLKLTLKGGIGYGTSNYNAYNMGCRENAFTDVTGEMSLNYQPLEWLTLSPYVAAGDILDHRIRDGVEADGGSASGKVWGGLRATAGF